MKDNTTMNDSQRGCMCGLFGTTAPVTKKTSTSVLTISTPDGRATKMDAFSPRSRTSSTPIPIMKSDEVVHEQNEDSGSVKLYDSTGDVWQLEGGYSPTGSKPVGFMLRNYAAQYDIAKKSVRAETPRIDSVATRDGDHFLSITESQGDQEKKESPLLFAMDW